MEDREQPRLQVRAALETAPPTEMPSGTCPEPDLPHPWPSRQPERRPVQTVDVRQRLTRERLIVRGAIGTSSAGIGPQEADQTRSARRRKTMTSHQGRPFRQNTGRAAFIPCIVSSFRLRQPRPWLGTQKRNSDAKTACPGRGRRRCRTMTARGRHETATSDLPAFWSRPTGTWLATGAAA